MDKKFIGTVFSVARRTKTAGSVEVGDYESFEQAKEAMLEHYKQNHKRGKFFYSITKEGIYELNGMRLRQVSMSLCGDGDDYKKFTSDELCRITNS